MEIYLTLEEDRKAQRGRVMNPYPFRTLCLRISVGCGGLCLYYF